MIWSIWYGRKKVYNTYHDYITMALKLGLKTTAEIKRLGWTEGISLGTVYMYVDELNLIEM